MIKMIQRMVLMLFCIGLVLLTSGCVNMIAGAIQRITGTKAPLITKPLPVDDPKQRRPDITLARSVLGWEPQVGLEEGLKSTIAYFSSRN